MDSYLGIETIGALLTETEEPIDWIVEGMVARAGQSFFVARPGAGKSLLSYHLAACVVTGTPFLGEIEVQAGAVAYIDLDMHRRGIAAMRAAAALRGLGIDDADIPSLPFYIAAQRSSMDLRDAIVLRSVLDELRAIPGLALVVLDTFSDLHHGKEQSPDDMTDTASGALEIATECNCGVLLIHHSRKNGGNELEDVRGAGSIVSKADAVFILRTERDDDGDPGKLTLLQRKARLTEEAKPRPIALEVAGDIDGTLHSYRFTPGEYAKVGRPPVVSTEAEDMAKVLLQARPDLSRKELVSYLMAAGISKSSAYRVAKELSQNGPDTRVGNILGKTIPLDIQGETDSRATNGHDDSQIPSGKDATLVANAEETF